MTARSYLFVPGDQPRKIAKALDGEAEAVILDLEDSVSAERKDEALRTTVEVLRGGRRSKEIWVRLNPGCDRRFLAELTALPLDRVTGVVLPKLTSHEEMARLGHRLDALEARDRLAPRSTAIIGIITEKAAALFAGSDFGRPPPRLAGYTWGVEDLSADIGRPPIPGLTTAGEVLYRHAQLFCLTAATAAGIAAIDAVSPNFKDLDALRAETRFAAELGFVAKAAIHPAQIAPIHDGLQPGSAALDWARKVTDALDANPSAAALQVDGRMVDRPHFAIARRILDTKEP